MYKAVFLDLDGTLLDDEKNISDENKKAIKYAQEKGVIVCICSGRQIDITRKFREMAGADNYMICSNGAIIYDDDLKEELFASYLDKGFCKKAFDYAENNDLTVRLDTKYGRFVNNEKFNASTEVLITEGIEKFLMDNNVIQMSIVGSTYEEIDKAKEFLDVEGGQTKLGNRYSENFPIKYCAFNCINKNVSKGNAILGLCKYLKIDINDVIAVGDELNDISMIEVAGLGVAMENGYEEVKAVAKEITKSNIENGVAFTIYNNI